MTVLVTQPVHQHAYETAVAAQEAGALDTFVTGLYHKGIWRHFLRRFAG